MDKHRLAFYILFFIVIVILIYITFRKSSNDHLDEALRDLDSAQHRLDTALLKIDDSKKIIDSMRNEFIIFQKLTNGMRLDVQQLNINNRANQQRLRTSLNELGRSKQKVVEQLKVRRDTLPEIKIY
jgi:hypothetical protein